MNATLPPPRRDPRVRAADIDIMDATLPPPRRDPRCTGGDWTSSLIDISSTSDGGNLGGICVYNKQYYLDRVWFLIRIDGNEPIATVFIRIVRLDRLKRIKRLDRLKRIKRLERFGWRVRIVEKLNVDRVGYLDRTDP